MCGRLNVTDSALTIGLLISLGIDLNLQPLTHPLRTGRFIRATNKISIVLENAGKRQLQDAIWWLLLEQSPEGFKPNQYTSFNTRYDKLNTKGSAGFIPYRKQRCIIPATGFGETEVVEGKSKYTDFIGDQALAFGGLYRTWLDKSTGELIHSCSIITLPPHLKLMPYHTKAMPLMLPTQSFDAWLSSSEEVGQFDALLKPRLQTGLTAIPIDKPSTHQEIGERIYIVADA